MTLSPPLAYALAAALQMPAGVMTFSDLLTATDVPEAVRYTGANEKEQSLWKFAPADGKPGESRPAIVLIHGGAWIAGDADVFFPHARYFASRGMVAFSINYRLIKPGCPGMQDCVDDCRAALVFIRDHAKEWGVDPSKIVVMGDSAGGHLAALAGMIPAPAGNPGVAAMILCNPIVDLTEGDWMKFVIGGRALEKNPPPDAKIPTAQQTALARELSPLCLARPGLPPTLLMHGSEDHVVNPHQVRAFAAAMSSCGNSCELDMIAGARHAFILPKYTAPEPLVVESLKKADAFLASLGFVSGPPTLEVSSTPAWQPLK